MRLIQSVVFDIEDKRKTVPLMLMGDVHLGHPNHNEKRWIQYLRYADKEKAYMIYMGDMIEMGINAKHLDTVAEQTMTPSKQIELIVNTLKNFKGRNLAYINGTHEGRVTRYTTLGIVHETIAEKIGAIPLDLGGYITLKFNNQVKYRFVVYHGTKGSQSPEYQINKARRIFGDFDVLAMGHIHQMYHRPVDILYPNEKDMLEARDVHLIRTGSFVKYTPYDFRNLRDIYPNGCPILFLRTDERDIRVDINGEGPTLLEYKATADKTIQ